MKLFPSTIIVSRSIDQSINYTIETCQSLGHKSIINNPDLFLINQETGWTIDLVRSLKKFISQKPFCHQNKVVIISQADNLNIESQNALLKTLEEPGENNYIFLITARPSKLLNTITSRCHLIKITNLDNKKSSKEIIKITGNFLKDTSGLEELYKNKDQILPFLKEQLALLQKDLINKPSTRTSQIIQRIIKSISMIESNVDPRSALDFVFLA